MGASIQRSYRDSRFPHVEVRSDGRGRFDVVSSGKVVESFRGCEDLKSKTVSEAFAARRAAVYYRRLAESAMEALDMAPPIDTTSVVSDPPRDFADEAVLTPDQVLDLWERAQAMEPGPERDALVARLRRNMPEFESNAAAVVARLIG